MKKLSLLLLLSIHLLSCSEEKKTTIEGSVAQPETTEVLPDQTNDDKPTENVIKEKDDSLQSTPIQEDAITISKTTSQEETVVAQKEPTKVKESTIEPEEQSNVKKELVKKELVKKTSIHTLFNTLLVKNVSPQGEVDYDNLKKNHSSLKAYIKSLGVINYKTLGKKDQLAFLINYYNALTLDLILKNYPLKSVMDLPKAWDTPVVTYRGQSLTLNNIEHQLIRENFKEPRIHFACNCAAKSCPKLLNYAYEGAILEKQLKAQTISFLNNKSKNKITANEITISKIFEWYGGDFGNVTEYIKKYKPEVNSTAKVLYTECDWALNKK